MSESLAADSLPDAPVSGAYGLRASGDGLHLSAATEEGMRCGRATIRQLAAQPPLPCGLTIRDWPALKVRGLHLDLKFWPPRFDAVLRWLDQMAAWKLNMLVLEYEDRFPYEKVKRIACPAAWSRDQIQELLHRARAWGIEVVPLLQCLGHVEYILWHGEYAVLRELPHVLSQYCPSNPESFALFTAMADEILDLHADVRFLHVGGDETAFLGRCPTCSARAQSQGPLGVYAAHLRRVCEWVSAKGIRPIVWDDILRQEPERITALPPSTVLMHWDYETTGIPTDPRKRRQANGAADMTSGPSVPRPVYRQYREAGYDVIMAPCYNAGGLIPSAPVANTRHLAQQAALHGGLGVCSTHWAVFLTSPDFAACGAAACAEFSWNPLPSRDDLLTSRNVGVDTEFERRFCRAYFGLPDDTLMHALRLLSPGPMYIPSDGRAYPTFYAEPSFVDISFTVDRDTFAACATAFFRPDWATTASRFTWEQFWRDKLSTLRREPHRAMIRTLLADVAANQERGLALLREERRRASRHADLLDGFEAGGEIRLWRTRDLLHALDAGPKAELNPAAVDALIAHHASSLSETDARELVRWHLVGRDDIRSLALTGGRPAPRAQRSGRLDNAAGTPSGRARRRWNP